MKAAAIILICISGAEILAGTQDKEQQVAQAQKEYKNAKREFDQATTALELQILQAEFAIQLTAEEVASRPASAKMNQVLEDAERAERSLNSAKEKLETAQKELEEVKQTTSVNL